MKQNKGLSVHCHHDIMIEYCKDYEKRIKYIKSDKLKSEQKIRLNVFKLLSKEAIESLPKEFLSSFGISSAISIISLIKADTDWKKAYADWKRADADSEKAYADWKGKEKWHKKYCGCKYWNGKELVFE